MYVRNKDCFDFIKKLTDGSIDAIITDPPYFLDSMSSSWTAHKRGTTKGATVTNLPSGMKFDVRQSLDLEEFMYKLSIEAFRVLKPGGFYLLFSSPRLYHGLATGVQRAGFEIRDQLVWTYTQSQAKACRMDHFVDKCKHVPDSKKKELKKALNRYRTPQVRSLFEPICVAMKPVEYNFVRNWVKYKTGLIYVEPEDPFPTSIYDFPKPSSTEKEGNNHPTVKPVELMKKLIKLFCPADGTLLDPFLGSGTTAVAAVEMGIKVKGCEKNKDYFEIIKKRIKKAKRNKKK